VGRVAPFLGALTTTLLAYDSQAQSFHEITPSAFTRDTGFRKDREHPNWINRADCLLDDVLHFEMKVISPTDNNLEVWVGSADCTSSAQRLNDDAGCWQVLEQLASDDSFRLDIRVQDVVARRPQAGYRAVGTSEVCETDWSSSLTFYFMYVDDTDRVITHTTWPHTGVDIKGPTPPSNVVAGVAEEALLAKWTSSNSTDLLGYRIYCAPVGATVAPATPTAAPSDAGGDGGGSAVVAPGVDNPPADTLNLDGGGISDSGAAGGETCSAPGLVAGEFPPIGLEECGSSSSSNATQAYARGLQNGQQYAIAVAATDDIGNAGRLSNVACGTPVPVAEFFEDYRGGGGGGGGGICSIAAIGQTSGDQSGRLVALGFGVLAALFGFRRKR
jgi:hypothetical protein